MKRFSAPNTDIKKGSGVYDICVEWLFEGGGFDDVGLDGGLMMTWRFWEVVIAWSLWRASGAGTLEVVSMLLCTYKTKPE